MGLHLVLYAVSLDSIYRGGGRSKKQAPPVPCYYMCRFRGRSVFFYMFIAKITIQACYRTFFPMSVLYAQCS